MNSESWPEFLAVGKLHESKVPHQTGGGGGKLVTALASQQRGSKFLRPLCPTVRCYRVNQTLLKLHFLLAMLVKTIVDSLYNERNVEHCKTSILRSQRCQHSRRLQLLVASLLEVVSCLGGSAINCLCITAGSVRLWPLW